MIARIISVRRERIGCVSEAVIARKVLQAAITWTTMPILR
jgi:hypothetical protein